MFWARMPYRELSLGQEPAIMQETQALRQDLFVFLCAAAGLWELVYQRSRLSGLGALKHPSLLKQLPQCPIIFTSAATITIIWRRSGRARCSFTASSTRPASIYSRETPCDDGTALTGSKVFSFQHEFLRVLCNGLNAFAE